MNIRLVPFTWARHIHVALVTVSTAVLCWWALIMLVGLRGTLWPAQLDGPIFIGVLSFGVVLGGVVAEGMLDARGAKWWVKSSLLGAVLVGGLGAGGAAWLAHFLLLKISSSAASNFEIAPVISSVRYAVWGFCAGGLFTGIGLVVVRGSKDKFNLLGGGLAGGLAASVVWWVSKETYDPFVASGLAAVAWGAVTGLLAWIVPSSLYSGWVRVLSGSRFGWRVRVDSENETSSELVVGHYPLGLDMWLPANEGVRELHLSVANTDDGRYVGRGMSLYPTVVSRFLERVDLRYDPEKPVPLETPLSSGDMITLSDGQTGTHLEFVMLPKRELK